MEIENALYKEIFSLTKKIQDEYPELTKYLVEIPQHVLSNPEEGVNEKALKDYLETLKNIISNYAK